MCKTKLSETVFAERILEESAARRNESCSEEYDARSRVKRINLNDVNEDK
jgi:hypothetical protein